MIVQKVNNSNLIYMGNKKLMFLQVEEYIESKGYRLISTSYVDSASKLTMKCPNGHVTERCWSAFKRGRRCNMCAKNRKLNYNEIKSQIEEKGYILLSGNIKNTASKIELKCPLGHCVKMSVHSFRAKPRCSVCYGNAKPTIKSLSLKMQSENYTLVSTEYINNNTKLDIKCDQDHLYQASWNSYSSGRRCPVCQHPKRKEKECRDIIEQLTGGKFPTKRPKWLRTSDMRNPLELDGYCEELNIAFEYDGEMHYKPIFGIKELEKIQKRDRLKEDICKIYGIILIRVSYKVKDLKQHIKNQLEVSIECQESKNTSKNV